MYDPIRQTVSQALAEDIGHGDITSQALVPEGAECTATLVAKQDGVLSGISVFLEAFELAGACIPQWTHMEESRPFAAGDTIATFDGQTAAVLAGERTALNFVQRLSGIATLTRQFVAALEGLECRICDTRKTTPLLRALEKEAVRHGGGANHRFNLTDGVLIKENHIAAAGGIPEAVRRAREYAHHLARIEVEVTCLEELREALDAGADVVMLDNMNLETMAEAVRMNRASEGGGAVLEASGNVTLERVRAIAETGVDFISCGVLTHSAPAIDMSLLIQPLQRYLNSE